MKINVMSQETIEYASAAFHDRTAIISVSNPEARIVDFPRNDNIVAVLYLSFADTSDEGPESFNASHAEEIRDFLQDVMGRIDRLIVQCEFGVSRSAGIAAAIMKTLSCDDSAIFNDPWFVPNMLCYRLTYDALHDDEGHSVLGEEKCEFRDNLL